MVLTGMAPNANAQRRRNSADAAPAIRVPPSESTDGSRLTRPDPASMSVPIAIVALRPKPPAISTARSMAFGARAAAASTTKMMASEAR